MLTVLGFIFLSILSSYISHPYYLDNYNNNYNISMSTFRVINGLNCLNNSIKNFSSIYDPIFSHRLCNSIQLLNPCYLEIVNYSITLHNCGKSFSEVQHVFFSFVIQNLFQLKDFDFLPAIFFWNFYKILYILGKTDFLTYCYPNIEDFFCFFKSGTVQILENNHEIFKTSFNKLNNQVDYWIKSSSKIDDVPTDTFKCSDFYLEKNQIHPTPLDLVVKNEVNPEPYFIEYNKNISTIYACTFGIVLSTTLFLAFKASKLCLSIYCF